MKAPTQRLLAIFLMLLAGGCAGSRATGATATATATGSGTGDAATTSTSTSAGGDAGTVAHDISPLPDDGPPWLDGTHPEEMPEAEWFVGVGLADNTEQAQSAAEQQLAPKVWGAPEQHPAWPLAPVFEPDRDVMRKMQLDDGRVAVLLAIERSALTKRIRAWMEAAPPSETSDASSPTGMLAAVLTFVEYQEAQRFGCARIIATAGAECEAPAMQVAHKQLANVGTKLRLEQGTVRGAPMRDGKLLRPLSVRAIWRNSQGNEVPWPKLPLRLQAPPDILASESGQTNADGYAEVALSGAPSADLRVTVTVDLHRLLGKRATLWKPVAIDLTVRKAERGQGQAAVYLREFVGGNPAAEKTAEKTMTDGLRLLGRELPASLPEAALAELEKAAAGIAAKAISSETVRRATDAAGGMADLVVVGEVHSEFVSRAGGRSVWYEAFARLMVFDGWSGKHLHTIEESTRASGIGEQNAAEKAMRQLGSLLAERLHELLGSAPTASL